MMRTFVRILIVAMMLFCGGQSARSQRVSDDITVSVLTCSPGQLIYELYGHTAIRVVDHTLGTDVVFNYGVFDFTRENFEWHFLLGETDYMVMPLPYVVFAEEYVRRGSSIVSQELNLTREEANELYNSLIENARPENKMYRYNYLTNNCSTKVRDIIEQCVHGTVAYKEQDKQTYRQSLHEWTSQYSWTEAGEDLLLGATTDTLLDDRSAQFLPEYLRSYLTDATIFDSVNNARPLLKGDEVVLLEARDMPRGEEFPVSPLQCGIIFVAVMVVIAAIEYLTRYQLWFVDLLLMPGVGVAGLLVTFMFFFSEHPSVDTNWQIWVLNPLPLICMPWVVKDAIQRKHCFYHYANATILIVFLIATPWIPQSFSILTMPLTLGLLTRPVSYIFNFQRLRARKPKSRKKKS